MKNVLSIQKLNSKFYNYIYLDPTKPGKYQYAGLYISFLYEPYYVGKGTNNRYKTHLTYDYFKKSWQWRQRIENIAKNGKDPIHYIEILNNTEDESLAYRTEEYLIKKIGRQIDNGPLFNKMFRPSNYHQSEFMKEYNPMFNITSEQHSKNVKEKQWDSPKGAIRRKNLSKRMTGRNNHSTKIYEIFDPDGNKYIVRDGLGRWAKEMNLSVTILRNWVNRGVIRKTYDKDNSFEIFESKRKLKGWEICQKK